MNEYVMIKSDELYHHGILGQKWGVRRYQNADGSLTEAGKKRQKDIADTAKIGLLTGTSAATAVTGGKLVKNGIDTIKAYKDTFGGTWNNLLKAMSGEKFQNIITLQAGDNIQQFVHEIWLNEQGIKDIVLSGVKVLGGAPIAAIGAMGITSAGALAIKKMIEKSKEKKEENK